MRPVIASEAKQSRGRISMIAALALDCFVAHAPRNDSQQRRAHMERIEAAEQIDHHRRRLLGAASVTLAAAQFGMTGVAAAQPGSTNTNASFSALKQIDAGLLNVGYAEAGPADGPVV